MPVQSPSVPEENYARPMAGARDQPLLVGSERDVLLSFLEFHRRTFALKWEGLTDEQLSRQVLSPSSLTMHGLVRHFAGFERWWMQNQFLGSDAPMLYYSDEDPDQDFNDLSGNPRAAFASWETECARSREIVATASLDDTGIQTRDGRPISLRRIVVHCIAEYARHNGHADIIREQLDGATGF
jgi:Protein of unknown function (DUF664)